MQTTSNSLSAAALEPTVAEPAARAGVIARLGFIDAVRLALTIMVIMVHAGVAYGGIGSWTYEDPVQDELTAVLLSLFIISAQSFFMGLFFFFAGFFTPASFDRKGAAGFWKDRLIRLGIPMLLYTFFLSSIPNYLNAVANQGLRMGFWQFFRVYFWRSPDEGPTWFIFALLVFSAGYTLYRLIKRTAQPAGGLKVKFPGLTALLTIALVMAACTFAVAQWLPLGEMFDILGIFSLQLQFFPTYIILFVAGILARRNEWLDHLPLRSVRGWGITSALLLIALPAFMILGGAADNKLDLFMSGLNWRCVVMSLWLGLACISFSMTITLATKKWLDKASLSGRRLARIGAEGNYTAYLLHPLVLVPLTHWMSQLNLPSMLKFLIVAALTTLICYGLAPLLRRLPGLQHVL